MKLYETHETIKAVETMMEEWAAEHEGDITDFPLWDEMEKLEMARDEKALAVAVVVKNYLAEAEMIKAEKLALQKRQQAAEKAAEKWKGYIATYLPAGTKLSGPQSAISWRKSTSVEIPEGLTADQIAWNHGNLVKIKMDFNLAAIKDSMTDGELLVKTETGEAVITTKEKQNIQIK